MGVSREIETAEDKLKKLEFVVDRAYRKIEEKHIFYSEFESLRSEKMLLRNGP